MAKKKQSIVERLKFLLQQRRVWVFILSVLAFVATYLGYANIAELIAVLAFNSGLALWSFAAPKKK
jgi:hypothetical protein